MRVLVTGGASGLGEAITRRLAAHADLEVAITYHRSGEAARELVERYPNVSAYPLDFRDAAALAAFLDGFAGLDPDALVNNAVCGLVRKHAHRLGPGDLAESFGASVLPTIALTTRAIQHFRKKQGGRIVTVLSEGLAGPPALGLAEYLANKAYLASFAASWAVENAAYGITSNCVLPSFMETGLNADLDPRAREQRLASAPAGRFLEVDEAAEAVEFLVTCRAVINGARWVVSPGRRD